MLQRRGCLGGALGPYAIDPHRPRNVLELLLANILEDDFNTPVHILLPPARNANPARFGQSFQSRRYVHAVAPNVSAVDNDVTGVDAHTELDPLLLRQAGVTLAHRTLDVDGPAHRGYHAGKFHQQTVADDPHDTAAVFCYFGIDNFASINFERRVGTLLTDAHQPAVAGNIGREDGGQMPFNVRVGHSIVPDIEQSLWSGARCVYRATISALGHLPTPACL